ncbi:MAG: PAS domain-containing protein [Gemmatirosa sp.]|nr:PAS domain-containing protein [Gemmatirosa sp.]
MARVAGAAAVWLAALALTVMLASHIQRANFVFFWGAVLFAAWYAGLAVAVAAAAAAVAAVDYFVMSSYHAVGTPSVDDLLTLTIFIGAATLVSALAAGRSRAQRLVLAYARDLEAQAVELRQQTGEANTLSAKVAQTNARLEHAVAETERARTHVASILDGFSDVVAAYDAEWRWTYLNPAARELLRALGVDPDHALGSVVWEALPQVVGTRFEREMRRAASERRVVDYDVYQPELDRWFESRVVPADDGSLTTFARDVTDRRRALAAERAAGDRARRLLAVTTGLSEAVTPDDVADVIFRDGLAAIGADAGSLALLRTDRPDDPLIDDGSYFDVVRVQGYAQPLVDAYRRFALQPGRPLSDAVLTMSLRLIASRAEWARLYPDNVVMHEEGYEAFAAIPVVSGGRVLAAISASFRTPVVFDDSTRTLLASLGEQCGLALARARAFEAERRARDFVGAILSSVRDAFVAFDAEFRYTYVNARAEEVLGHTAGDLLGRVLWDVFPTTRTSAFSAAMRRVRASRQPESVEAYGALAGRWTEARVYPAADGGVTMFFEDISARRRAQEASTFLAEASRVLSASLDYETTLRTLARAAVPRLGDWCAVDVVADPAHPVWPPRLERLAVVHEDPAKIALGARLTEHYPTDWSEPEGVSAVLRDRTSLFVPEVTDEMLVGGARDAEHLALLRAFGFTSIIVVPLVARDVTLGTLTLCTSESRRRYDAADLALAQDLAQRAAMAVDNARLFGDAERARHEAEQANRAKSQFLSTMSHELRTPLNAIAGYTDLLDLGLRGPVTDAQREDLTRIRRSAKVLMSLVNDVLNFARLEVGQVDFRLEAVRVDQMLGDLEALIAPQVRARRLAFEQHGCGEAVFVRADADRVKQILSNLLTNAIKFTDEGGRVAVSCAPDAARGLVTIAVTDTGRGIDADKLGIIFEPFVQVDRHLTHESLQGVGLGLAISRDLARAMGGDLGVSSTLGVGSTFALTLPGVDPPIPD